MKKNFLLTVLALGSFGLSRLVYNQVALRTGALGPDFLSDFNALFSYCTVLVVIYGQAFGALSNKFVSEHVGAGCDEEARRLHTALLAVVGVLAIVALVGSYAAKGVIAAKLHIVDAGMVGAVLPYAGLYALYFTLKYAFYSFDRVAAYCATEIVACAVFFAVLAVAAVAGSTALAAQAFNLHATLFSVIALWLLRDRWLWRGALGALRRQAGRMAHFGFHIWINQMTGFGVLHLSILILSYADAAPEARAQYSALLNSLTPLNLFPMAVSALLLPAFARNYGAAAEGAATNRRLVLTGETAISIVMVPVFLIGVAMAPEATRLLVGADAPTVRGAFVLLLAAFTIRFHTVPLANYLNATRFVHVMAYISIAAGAVAAGVWWASARVWNPAWAAAGNLALIATAGVLIVWTMRRRAAEEWFRFGSRHWAPVAVLVAGVVVVGWFVGSVWMRGLVGVGAAGACLFAQRAAVAAFVRDARGLLLRRR